MQWWQYGACNAHAPYCHLLSSVARLAIPCLFTLSHTNGTILYKKMNVKYVFWFSLQLLSGTFLILRMNSARHCHRCTHVIMWGTRYSYPILVKLEFSRRFSKNSQIPNMMNIRRLWAELFRADGRTDMPKLAVALLGFVNAPKSGVKQPRLKLN
jgi:hypothetical protein